MGAAVGVSRQWAWNRWGTMVHRYEDAGLLDNHEADIIEAEPS